MKIQDLRIGDIVTVKGHDFPMKVVGLFGDKDVQFYPCVDDYEGDIWEEDVAELEPVMPRRSNRRHIDMKITEDGFAWKTISAKAAELLFNAGEEEIYILYDDDSEGLVETPEQLKEATERGCRFGVEVGWLPNAISTPDPAEFVKQLISPLRWVKGKGPVLTYAKVLRTKYEIERQTHGDGFVLYLGRYPLRTYASIDKAKEGAKQNLDESILKVLKL